MQEVWIVIIRDQQEKEHVQRKFFKTKELAIAAIRTQMNVSGTCSSWRYLVKRLSIEEAKKLQAQWGPPPSLKDIRRQTSLRIGR